MEHPAKRYASPLSAHDMVALATSLLAYPQVGRSLREKILKIREMAKPVWFNEWKISEVKGEVRAACGPHLMLWDACTTGIALALLPLSVSAAGYGEEANCHVSSPGHLCVQCYFASDEAVEAFYAALAQPTCVVNGLAIRAIRGAAFGTTAAAAHLGRCLDVTSTIQQLEVDVAGFCGEAVWIAFSHALTSNATLKRLSLTGSSFWQATCRHVSATLADSDKLSGLQLLKIGVSYGTRPDMEGWGIMLKYNSTITHFELQLASHLPQGGALLAPVWEALVINTTLRTLIIKGISIHQDVVTTDVTSADDDADDADSSEVMAAMLRTNRSLRYLDISSSGMVCNASVFYEGLSPNNTLEHLEITVNGAGAQALMTVLAAAGDGTADSPPLKYLALGNLLGRQSFPTAVALGNMLASNMTLKELDLCSAPYSELEWAATILPALSSNDSLEKVNFGYCPEINGELVYDCLLELLGYNMHITDIGLYGTPLHQDGKAPVVDAVVRANREYRAALKYVPTVTTTTCRMVLCGHPLAGKSTLLHSMILRLSSDVPGTVTTTQRTRGVDIENLMINDELNMWVWDFAARGSSSLCRISSFPMVLASMQPLHSSSPLIPCNFLTWRRMVLAVRLAVAAATTTYS